MIKIEIPGRPALSIAHVALDYNGTIAVDGKLLPSVRQRLLALAERVRIHVLTADTYGSAREQLRGLDVLLETFPSADAAPRKAAIVRALGNVACLGNGFNDMEMFDASQLSIAVLGREGMCAALLSHAHVAVTCPEDGLDLLLQPDRLRATLRT